MKVSMLYLKGRIVKLTEWIMLELKLNPTGRLMMHHYRWAYKNLKTGAEFYYISNMVNAGRRKFFNRHRDKFV